MAIDASVYSQFQPVDIAGSIQRGMEMGAEKGRLSDLAKQREKQQALETAYSKNISPDGTLNRQGLLSDLANAKLGTEAMQAKNTLDTQDEQHQQRKFDLFNKQMTVVGGAMEGLASLPPEQRAALYPQLKQKFVAQGLINPKDSPDQYDDNHFNSFMKQYHQTKDYMERQKTGAEIEHLKAQAFKDRKEATTKESGKPLAAEQSDKLAGHDASLHMIGDLRNTITENKDSFGPVAGRLASMNPYDTRGQSVSALFKKAAQTIGKSLEGGKLTDQDYAKYQKMLPTQADTTDVANAKLDQLERMITSQRNSDLDTYSRAGSNVGKFALSNPPDISVMHPKPGKQAASSVGMNSANAAPPAIKPGKEEDGFVFMGGDPSNPKSWKKAR